MRKRANKVIAYVRVSTDEQSVSGLGLADQRFTIERETQRRGWTDVEYLADEGFSAKNLTRPAISKALDALTKGEASILVVSKLDRLSRSLLDFASLMDRAKREGWQLVVLDLAIDTTTPSGQLMANVMASFAEYERQLIGQRTSAALQQKKAQGARLGRPKSLDSAVVCHIVALRKDGKSTPVIANQLNIEAVPTARNGVRWYPSTVSAVLRSVALDRQAQVA